MFSQYMPSHFNEPNIDDSDKDSNVTVELVEVDIEDLSPQAKAELEEMERMNKDEFISI